MEASTDITRGAEMGLSCLERSMIALDYGDNEDESKESDEERP